MSDIISVRVTVKPRRILLARAVLGVANVIAWLNADLAFRFVEKAIKPLCVYDGDARGY